MEGSRLVKQSKERKQYFPYTNKNKKKEKSSTNKGQ